MSENNNPAQDSQFLFEKLVYCIEKFSAQLGVANAFTNSFIGTQDAQIQRLNQEFDMAKKTEVENLKKDLEGLASYLRRTQIDLYDVLQDLQDKNKNLETDHLFDYKALEEADSVIDRMTKNLPKRETPILPAGNVLAVNTFLASSFAKEAQMTFGLYLGNNEGLLKIEAINKMALFLEKLQNTLFLLARWSNLILDKKEFIWTPPKKDGDLNQTQPDQFNQPQQDQYNQQPSDQSNQPPTEQANLSSVQSPENQSASQPQDQPL